MAMIEWPQTYAQCCGLWGSLLLIAAPVRDQIDRHFITKWDEKNDDGLGTLSKGLAEGLRNRASGWHWLDSLTLSAGAILLALSYTLTI